MECRVTMHLRELLEKRMRILFAVAACVNNRATQSLASCPTKQDTVVMRAVIQRVSRASVTIAGEITGQIGQGLLVLLGVAATDSDADADYLVEKIAGLRIFGDAEGKMNRSATDIQAAILVVSQFTLYGDVRRGRRPSFDAAAPPDKARQLYEYFVSKIRAGLNCQTGRFQEMMQVELVNEGPVTILLDSTKAF
jgi:D-aminoacyl-tRNA deacylase